MLILKAEQSVANLRARLSTARAAGTAQILGSQDTTHTRTARAPPIPRGGFVF